MENYVSLIPGISSHPEVPSQPIAKVADEHMQSAIIGHAISVVSHHLGCGHPEAISHICRDWMELRGVSVLGENPLNEVFESPVENEPAVLRLWQWLTDPV